MIQLSQTIKKKVRYQHTIKMIMKYIIAKASKNQTVSRVNWQSLFDLPSHMKLEAKPNNFMEFFATNHSNKQINTTANVWSHRCCMF